MIFSCQFWNQWKEECHVFVWLVNGKAYDYKAQVLMFVLINGHMFAISYDQYNKNGQHI